MRVPLSSIVPFSVVLSLPCSQLSLPNLSWKHAKKAGAGDTNSSILNNSLYHCCSECIYREIHDVIQKWLQRLAMRHWEAAVSSQLQLVSREGRSDGHLSAGLNHPQVEAQKEQAWGGEVLWLLLAGVWHEPGGNVKMYIKMKDLFSHKPSPALIYAL